MSKPAQAPADEKLVRAIDLPTAVLFVVGSVVGSGIFLTTGVMAEALPRPGGEANAAVRETSSRSSRRSMRSRSNG